MRTIQDALNQVPASDGGPDPPLVVDGLCWGKTIAAIRSFQKTACGFRWPDGKIDPGRRTHGKLKEYFVPANPYVVPLIYMMLPTALGWIHAARSALREAEFSLLGKASNPRGLTLLNKYFHLGQLSKTAGLAEVARIRSLYNTMETCIARSTPMTQLGSGYFQEDSFENRHFAYTWAGGLTKAGPKSGGPPKTRPGEKPVAGVRKDTIYICPRKLNVQHNDYYRIVILHELAHFCGPVGGSPESIEDYGYRRKPGFFQLPSRLALRTADCYAHFAGEAKLGQEAPHR
ncbi:MAG: hypothetical protein GY953_30285 [bacterium]|nr:hypothetical protein [bacterium]